MEITIIYGTETGNSESLAREAREARKKLTKLGYQARVVDMEDMTVEQLQNAGTLLVVTSTWGDGEPPSNAEALYQAGIEGLLGRPFRSQLCRLRPWG